MMIELLLLLLSPVIDGTRWSQGPAAAGTLRGAEIRVIVERTYIAVVANYEIERSGAPLAFDARRLPGQLVMVEGAFGEGFALSAEHGLESRQLTSPASAPGLQHFAIRYHVEGDRAEIPLFVPNAAPAPQRGGVSIAVVELGRRVLSAEAPGFAFAAGSGGEFEAVGDGVPVTVRLRLRGQTDVFRRAAPWIAATLALTLAALLAARALRRRRGRHAPAAGAPRSP
jgi:hypothetical protein